MIVILLPLVNTMICVDRRNSNKYKIEYNLLEILKIFFTTIRDFGISVKLCIEKSCSHNVFLDYAKYIFINFKICLRNIFLVSLKFFFTMSNKIISKPTVLLLLLGF